MPRKLFRPFFTFFLLACATVASAALEVSLTVSGDISEIQALLNFIDQHNRQQAANDNPLKVNLHSTTKGSFTALGTEALSMPRPTKLFTPQLSAEKLTPGQPTVITVAVRDDRGEVDTVALQVPNTNLSTDLYDDGTQGDAKARDGVWSVTLTPMETTPAGRYELIVTGFDRNGRALLTRNEEGEEQSLQARTEITIER